MYDGADYELLWPRDLFVSEARALLDHPANDGWCDRCEFLLDDAFNGPAPRDDLRRIVGPSYFTTRGKDFLRGLIANAGKLREATGQHRPYWSQRRSGPRDAQADGLQATVSQFVTTISQLDDHGYFENAFDKDCVDDPSAADPSTVIEHAIGVPNLWPPTPGSLAQDADVFFDVVEVLHDLVARPRKRWMHSFAGCGWHHGDFSLEAGRVLYRWRVNLLLERSNLGLRLAGEGDDVGRLVTTTDPARADLLRTMTEQNSPTTDRLRHAIALYRGRHAGANEKRSAVVVLSGVLEERRKLIKAELLGKDEDDLFMVANKFAIRHQNEQQKRDYSVEFLDWIFWWYLATIELTDHLVAR